MTAGPRADDAVTDAASPRRRLGLGAAVVLLIGALGVTVAIGIVRGAMSPVEDVVIEPTTVATTPAAAAVHVHVSGAVRMPGLYVLPAGARVVDAIAAAGGFAGDADRDAVNLARPLDDGEQLPVAREGEAPQPGQAAVGGAGPGGAGSDGEAAPIDLNTADAAQLETLPRIGPALAERIIAWRDDNGGFTSVEDLLAVPGIGDKMLESLRDLVTV